jgi:hypothetical protein
MEVKDWPLGARTINALLDAGYTNIDALDGKTIEDLLEIPGLGVKGLTELREWCKTKFKRVFKRRPKAKVLKDFKSAREIVNHLVPKTKDWARQLKIAEQLIEKYGKDLLLRVKPNEKVWSLLWYNMECGDKYIRGFMAVTEVMVEKKEEVKFDDPPEDFSTERTKSLKDFMQL